MPKHDFGAPATASFWHTSCPTLLGPWPHLPPRHCLGLHDKGNIKVCMIFYFLLPSMELFEIKLEVCCESVWPFFFSSWLNHLSNLFDPFQSRTLHILGLLCNFIYIFFFIGEIVKKKPGRKLDGVTTPMRWAKWVLQLWHVSNNEPLIMILVPIYWWTPVIQELWKQTWHLRRLIFSNYAVTFKDFLSFTSLYFPTLHTFLFFPVHL